MSTDMQVRVGEKKIQMSDYKSFIVCFSYILFLGKKASVCLWPVLCNSAVSRSHSVCNKGRAARASEAWIIQPCYQIKWEKEEVQIECELHEWLDIV